MEVNSYVAVAKSILLSSGYMTVFLEECLRVIFMFDSVFANRHH